MTSCNYTQNDLIICGHIYSSYDVYSRLGSKHKTITAYNEQFMAYDFRNVIKYAKVMGDLYVYNGGIKATGDIISYGGSMMIQADEYFVYNGDLVINGDFFTKKIHAVGGIYSWYTIPNSIVRKGKIEEIFND